MGGGGRAKPSLPPVYISQGRLVIRKLTHLQPCKFVYPIYKDLYHGCKSAQILLYFADFLTSFLRSFSSMHGSTMGSRPLCALLHKRCCKNKHRVKKIRQWRHYIYKEYIKNINIWNLHQEEGSGSGFFFYCLFRIKHFTAI